MKIIGNRILITLLTCTCLIVLLVSCAPENADMLEPATLEESMDVYSQVFEEINLEGQKSGYTVSVSGNDIIYDHDLAFLNEGYELTDEVLESDEFRDHYKEAMKKDKETYENIISTFEEETGIEGIRVIVNYNYDGKTIISRTFEKDTEKEK